MKKSVKILFLCLAVILSFALLVACSNGETTPNDNDTQDVTEGYREVIDLEGNIVTVPENIESIVVTSWKGAFESLVLLNRTDLPVGMCDTTRYNWLMQAMPELQEIPDYGNFDEVNIEELLKADADVIISPTEAPEANKKMRELGMPVYVDGAVDSSLPALESSTVELMAVAELIGETEKANEYLQWRQDILDLVSERVADIPEEERKVALAINAGINNVWNNTYTVGACIELAGGINAAADMFEGTYYGELSAEEIIAIDPDFMFQNTSVRQYGEELKGYFLELQADERYNSITAVQNGDAYIMPRGLSNWNGDTELGLGVITMAKIMYPDRFADIDVWELAQDFYSTFVGIEITEEDWLLMHPHDFDGAKPLEVYHD